MDDELRRRLRGGRRDYTGEIIAPPRRPPAPRPTVQPKPPTRTTEQPASAQAPTSPKPQKAKKARRLKLNFKSKKVFLPLLLVVVLAAAAAAWMFLGQDGSSPVPKNIQKQVSFPIYYPDPKKLPSGYHLDTSSFTNNKSAVLYAIKYAGGQQKVVISVQPKPSGDIVTNFNSQTLALHTTYQTPIGTATIGAIGTNSIVSLPTKDNDWIILTAPSNINQSHLRQVLSLLKK